jgi:TIR domain
MDKGIQIFLSYAHNDRRLAQELLTHLKPLQKQGQVTIWSTEDLLPGEEYTQSLHAHLNSAQIILILVSPDFLASKEMDYILPEAMERHNRGEARVIPIILSPVHWQETSFSKLQALPRNGKALRQWTNRDLAYLDIVEAIRKAVTDLTSPTKNQGDEVQLQEMLKTFSKRELRLLCFDLVLPPSISLNDKQEEIVDALLAYMKSQNRTQELAAYVLKRRRALS